MRNLPFIKLCMLLVILFLCLYFRLNNEAFLVIWCCYFL